MSRGRVAWLCILESGSRACETSTAAPAAQTEVRCAREAAQPVVFIWVLCFEGSSSNLSLSLFEPISLFLMNATTDVEDTLCQWREMVRRTSTADDDGRATDDLTRVTAAMAAIPGLAVYLSVDGSPWVHRLTPIEWGGW